MDLFFFSKRHSKAAGGKGIYNKDGLIKGDGLGINS
jgi:hypothetical protein